MPSPFDKTVEAFVRGLPLQGLIRDGEPERGSGAKRQGQRMEATS